MKKRYKKQSREIVIECDQTINCLEKELEVKCDEHTKLQQKVEASVRNVGVVEEQLRMMRKILETLSDLCPLLSVLIFL